MKRAILTLLLSIGLFCSALTPGCSVFSKPPEVVAVNVSDAARVGAESALRAWNDWILVGRPSLDQQRKVKDAYGQYKLAQVNLLNTAELVKLTKNAPDSKAKLEVAAANSGQALADLVSLIRQFGAKI